MLLLPKSVSDLQLQDSIQDKEVEILQGNLITEPACETVKLENASLSPLLAAWNALTLEKLETYSAKSDEEKIKMLGCSGNRNYVASLFEKSPIIQGGEDVIFPQNQNQNSGFLSAASSPAFHSARSMGR